MRENVLTLLAVSKATEFVFCLRCVFSITKSPSVSSSDKELLKAKDTFGMVTRCSLKASSASRLSALLQSNRRSQYHGAERPSKRRRKDNALSIALNREDLCTRLLVGSALHL